MRRVVAGVAVVLLLASCDSPADPSDGASKTPSVADSSGGASKTPSAAEYTAKAGEVCEALGDTVKLPTNGTVRYTVKFNERLAGGVSLPVCGIEPDGEYYDVAAKAPVFGRVRFGYGIVTEEANQLAGFPRYTPETVQQLLTLDQADPLSDVVPCARKPCKDGIHGYQYNFHFKAIKDNIGVIVEIDYITTDVSGDKKPRYRAQAIKAFTASMAIIVAGLK